MILDVVMMYQNVIYNFEAYRKFDKAAIYKTIAYGDKELSCCDRLRKIEDEETKKELKEKKFIRTRMTRIVLDDGEIEYLLSNIPETLIPEEEMKNAFFKRWQIEIGYDILKNKLHYTQIYTFNVFQDIKHTANIEIQKNNKNKNLKYEYKTNINF